jgi:hypothetical protein
MMIVIYLLSYLVTLFGGHVFTRALMKKFRPHNASGIEGAGAVIGFLERALTLTFVLAGQYTALGLVLTAKSIARHEELKDRHFAEYYLIGTLSSVLFAVLVGIALRVLLGSGTTPITNIFH